MVLQPKHPLMSKIEEGIDSPDYADKNNGKLELIRDNINTMADEANSTFPIVTTGTAAPTTTPYKKGDIFVDATTPTMYYAKGNTSSADWVASGGGMTFVSTVVHNANSVAAWTDLDLSAVVGSNTAMVYVEVKNNGAADEFRFRTNGATEEVGHTAPAIYGGGASASTIRASGIAYMWIMTDSSGIVEWRTTNVISTAITVLAYIK
jgi:hypothetical protein